MSDKPARNLPWERVSGLTMALLTCVPGFTYLAGRFGADTIVNSDYLLLQQVIPSLMNGTPTRDWAMPYASYLLPDWPLYGVALLFGPTPAISIAIFAGLQVALLALALRALANHFDTGYPTAAALTSFALLMHWVRHSGDPLAFVSTSYVHGGTAIAGVAMLALTLAFVESPSRRTVAAIAALSFGLMMSDRMFAVWALLPLGCSLIGLAIVRLRSIRQIAPWFVAGVIGSILAMPVPDLLLPTKSEYDLKLGIDLAQGWDRFYNLLELIMAFSPLMLPTTFIVSVGCVYLLSKGRSPFGHRFSPELRVVVLIFLGTLMFTTVGSQLLLTGTVGPGDRYMTLLFLAPWVLLPMLSFAGFGASNDLRSRRLAASAIVFAVAAVVLPTLKDIPRMEANRSQRPIDCVVNALEKSHSKFGITGYWDAREFELFSKERLVMKEFDRTISPTRVNTNLSRVRSSYDFAIIDTSGHYDGVLDQDTLLRLAGRPQQITTCDTWRVLDYGPGGLELS